jgi:hypothetical protein
MPMKNGLTIEKTRPIKIRWTISDRRWKDGRWEMGDGRWEMGDGRWG